MTNTEHISPKASPAAKFFRIVAAALISLAGAFILTVRLHPASMDFISYWSAGRLLLHHVNPYSQASVFAMERSQGFSRVSPLLMRNPPWAMFLVAPLGLLSPHISLFFWTLVTAACILISARLFVHESKDLSLVLLFAPAIACLASGQSSSFLLLGFTLFLRFHRTHPFFAGAALLLMAIKPHLFLVFWVVLMVDCIYRRRFLILAGGASALAASSLFATFFDPHIWGNYVAMLRTSALDQEVFPTASMLFRLLIDARAVWLLFVPSTLAIVWGIWYYARHRKIWNWASHGILLMLITILASPYGWFTDEIVLLPAILFALNCSEKRNYSGWILLVINAAAAIIFMALGISIASPAYVWTPLAWLLWFLYATQGNRTGASDGPSSAQLSGGIATALR